MKTTIIITAIVALLGSLNPALAGNCGGSGRNRRPSYRQPYYSAPPVCESSDPADCDTDLGDEEEDLIDDEEELIGDQVKVVECEVQVQHPITFEWKTVQSFDDELTAERYREQIEQRYWVIYNATGSSQSRFEEAGSRRDASSKASALRRSGARIVKLEQVHALVTETPLQPLFDEPNQVEGALASFVTSKVPNELQPLLGVWEAVTRDTDGQVKRLLLDLHADGTADLTVPTSGNGQSTIQRDFAVEDGKFKLIDGENELVLGAVLSATADRVVLSRTEGEITFTRP